MAIKTPKICSVEFRKQKKDCSTMLFMRTENRYLRQHYLKGYKLCTTELLLTEVGIENKWKKINLVMGGLGMICGKTFVELENVINLNKPIHLSFKNKQKQLKKYKQKPISLFGNNYLELNHILLVVIIFYNQINLSIEYISSHQMPFKRQLKGQCQPW